MIKTIIITAAALISVVAVYGRENPTDSLDRKIIEPMTVEVGFNKTVHIIFRSSIKYVDLGSADLIAGRAEQTENVLRIKAAVKDFKDETNFSVITADGKFYSFNAVYSDNPRITNIEIDKTPRSEEPFDEPTLNSPILLRELGKEVPLNIERIISMIYTADRSDVRNIGQVKYGIETLLKGLYIHNDLLFFHLSLSNRSFISYEVDYIRFKTIDKKKMKRTAVQETILYPVESYKELSTVTAKDTQRAVYVFDKITIPDGKYLSIEIYEKNGARNVFLRLDHKNLLGARRINDLKFK